MGNLFSQGCLGILWISTLRRNSWKYTDISFKIFVEEHTWRAPTFQFLAKSQRRGRYNQVLSSNVKLILALCSEELLLHVAVCWTKNNLSMQSLWRLCSHLAVWIPKELADVRYKFRNSQRWWAKPEESCEIKIKKIVFTWLRSSSNVTLQLCRTNETKDK